MSQVNNCDCACPSPQVVQVPGTQGDNGANGANGENAYTLTSQNFTVPVVGNNVNITVVNPDWILPGQNIYIEGAGTFEVVSKASTVITATYLDYVSNTQTGSLITAPAGVSPGGFQGDITVPLPIADGGTNAITKAAAQASLGLGQNAVGAVVPTPNTDITNAFSNVNSTSAVSTGLYLILGNVTVDIAGATFAASRTITIRIRNATTATTLTTITRNTQIQTTTSFPSIDFSVPPITSQVTAGDSIQIDIMISVVPSAGTIKCFQSQIQLVPLALS